MGEKTGGEVGVEQILTNETWIQVRGVFVGQRSKGKKIKTEVLSKGY